MDVPLDSARPRAASSSSSMAKVVSDTTTATRLKAVDPTFCLQKVVTRILDKRDPLVDSRAAKARAGLSLSERGDRVTGHMLIFGVIGPCPDTGRPRALDLVSAEYTGAGITIRIQEAVGLLDRGQLVRAD